MKNWLKLSFAALFLAGSFSACVQDECSSVVTYMETTPIFMSYADIRVPIENQAPRPLEQPGKIYFYQNYIFVNELHEGIHIIDNSDPYAPKALNFIAVPGNVDMAVKNGILYADNYTDLLAINISNPLNASLAKRLEDVFQPHYVDPVQGLCVGYSSREVTQTVPCDGNFNVMPIEFDNMVPTAGLQSGGAASNGGAGVGGSMARFTLAGDYLYTVDEWQLRVFDVSSPAAPDYRNIVSAGWGIETIFPYDGHLFLGGNSGMFIWSLANPEAPTHRASFQHATACDPVFVKDNYAYVTLRSGTACEGFTNQLDLVDISNLDEPSLAKTFPMSNPHGLSIKDNDLFVCEGAHGLKAFDISEPLTLDQRLRDHLQGFDAYDAIAVPGQADVLLVIGKDGLYQFDFSNLDNIREISKIGIQ